jgi:hypothetical protein
MRQGLVVLGFRLRASALQARQKIRQEVMQVRVVGCFFDPVAEDPLAFVILT